MADWLDLFLASTSASSPDWVGGSGQSNAASWLDKNDKRCKLGKQLSLFSPVLLHCLRLFTIMDAPLEARQCQAT